MNAPFLPVFPASAALLLLLKVTAALALAGLVTTLRRGRSAAARHLVWVAALAGAVALAPLARVAPRVPVRLPAAAERAMPKLVLVQPPRSASEARPIATPAAPAPVQPTATPRAPAWSGRSLAAPLGLLWLAGSMGVLTWCVFGHLGLWGLVRSSIPVHRQAWARHYGVEPAEDGAAARVQLALSSVVGTPLTWGWMRPIVLLPSRSSAWPLERRRAALLHELAHVRRGDYVAQLVATLACALYWFHPLVWWGTARLRSESEHACDDRVLATGASAPAYATDLLAVAHGARGPGGSRLAAIGMARRSHLEGRLLAVLDETRARGAVSRRIQVATFAATLLLLVPLAGLEPRALEANASTETWTASRQTTTTSTTTTTAESKQQETKKETKESTQKGTKADDGDDPGAAWRDRALEGGSHAVEDTVPASPGGTLELELQTGGSVEIHGWDRPEVSVHAVLRGGDWHDTQVSIGPEGSGVGVRTEQVGHKASYSTSHRFQIRVPKKYDVRLRSAGGSLTIEDVEGTFEGTTGGGEIVLAHARGRAMLSTGGGDIDVSDSDLRGSVTTGGGTVKLSRVTGGLRGSSGSGPVIYSKGDGDDATGDLTNLVVGDPDGRIRVGAKTNGFLHVTRAGGVVDLDDVPQGGEISTGGGNIRIRKGSGSIEAQTGGGDIEIGPIAGSVSATTGAGDVTIVLTSIGGRQQDIEVLSGTGKVVVDLPADLNARFDVETSYTESHAPTRITSAWTLAREPVSDWDDSEGTPRRHVRATGTAGRGEGLIHIMTVNGDLELRRAGAKGAAK